MDLVISKIQYVLRELLVNGIKYQKIGNAEYEMRLFEEQELEIYINDFTFKVTNADKTIYSEYVPLDSDTENQFAKDCESSDQVEFYFKLPDWFSIPTPIGNYNPDWAVVFHGDKRVYFVAETKNTGTPTVDLQKLRANEQLKIKCGKAHFQQFEDVTYRVVQSVDELI